MKPYRTVLAVGLVVLLGWAAVGHAAGRGGGGHPGFHGGRGGRFHGGHGGHRGGHGGHGGHGFHHRGFRGGSAFIGIAPFFWWPGYIYTPSPVIVAPPVYVQPGSNGYWYYCPSARAYYPYVAACPEPWVPVPTR